MPVDLLFLCSWLCGLLQRLVSSMNVLVSWQGSILPKKVYFCPIWSKIVKKTRSVGQVGLEVERVFHCVVKVRFLRQPLSKTNSYPFSPIFRAQILLINRDVKVLFRRKIGEKSFAASSRETVISQKPKWGAQFFGGDFELGIFRSQKVNKWRFVTH